MGIMSMREGEHKRVDVTAPYRSFIFPVLELILITGLAWMGIGWLDANYVYGFQGLTERNAVVVLWLALVLWRFLLPLLRARRRRFIVTNHRIIARTGRFGSHADSIPLRDVAGVRKRRGGISLAIRGYDRPLYFPDLPRPKKIERVIDDSVQQLYSPIWR